MLNSRPTADGVLGSPGHACMRFAPRLCLPGPKYHWGPKVDHGVSTWICLLQDLLKPISCAWRQNRFNLLIFFLRFLSYAYARFLSQPWPSWFLAQELWLKNQEDATWYRIMRYEMICNNDATYTKCIRVLQWVHLARPLSVLKKAKSSMLRIFLQNW